MHRAALTDIETRPGALHWCQMRECPKFGQVLAGLRDPGGLETFITEITAEAAMLPLTGRELHVIPGAGQVGYQISATVITFSHFTE